jgi:putative NADH-flavin reductase
MHISYSQAPIPEGRVSEGGTAVNRSKRIVVFGASGGIGGQVVRQALSMNHHVTAVVRPHAPFTLTHSALDVFRVPGLADPAMLVPTLQGAQVVISSVGPRGVKDGPVASTATLAILGAMEVAGVRRLVVVSAVPVGPVPQGESLLNRYVLLPLIGRLLRNIYADLAVMEQQVQRSDAEWTIVRPPRLVDAPLTGVYRSRIGGNVPCGYSISRANVAHAILAALDDPQTIRQPIGVAG